MSEWGGLIPTGRTIVGPSSDLIELDDGHQGSRSTAIAFHKRYQAHPLLHRGVEIIRSFLEFPMVVGLVELAIWQPDRGVFIYPTGNSWSAFEIARVLRDLDKPATPRAVAEMLYLSAMILQDAAEIAPLQGVFSHGALSPHRLLLKEDGQVQMIGYGIPQVELFAWREDSSQLPHEDSLRYTPPERLTAALEDVRTDLFSLGLIAIEWLCREPAYHGTFDQILQQAEAGTARKRLDSLPKNGIPAPLRALLTKWLDPEPKKRSQLDGFFADAEATLQQIDTGEDLAALMELVRSRSKRSKGIQPVAREAIRARGVPAKSASVPMGPAVPLSAVSMHTFSQRTGNASDAIAQDDKVGDEKRWGKASRRDETPISAPPRSQQPEEPSPPAIHSAKQALRDRLRQSTDVATEPTEPVVAPKQALRSQLRQSTDVAVSAEPTVDPKQALRDRLRRTDPPLDTDAKKSAPVAKSEPPPVASEVEKDPKAALRDRLRRSTAAETATPLAPANGETPPSEPKKPPPPSKPHSETPATPEDRRAALRDRLKGR